jgi:hypothetical protein
VDVFYKVEESVNDSLSMMRFCDLDIEDSVPEIFVVLPKQR